MDKKLFNKIIIIDDDPASGYLSQVLTEEMDIAEQVLHLLSADSGLSFIRHNCINEHAPKPDCPDLIFLDINMPGKNGYEFLDDLKKIGQQDLIHAKVIALSSSSAPVDKVRMQAYGVKGYLQKPINEVELLLLLQQTE